MVECIFVTTYQIPDLLHYLDDFITAGPAQSPQSVNSLVYHCILVSVWAPLQYSSWALISTPLTKWHVSPRRSCHSCKIRLVLHSLETGATDTSLNLLFDTCITLPKWCGWEGHSYAIWLTHCATSVLTKNFIWIFYGGPGSWRIGTALASGSSQDCCWLDRLWSIHKGPLVCWLPGLVPAAAVYCLRRVPPYSSCSSCLQTLLGQEPYLFSLTLMQ